MFDFLSYLLAELLRFGTGKAASRLRGKLDPQRTGGVQVAAIVGAITGAILVAGILALSGIFAGEVIGFIALAILGAVVGAVGGAIIGAIDEAESPVVSRWRWRQRYQIRYAVNSSWPTTAGRVFSSRLEYYSETLCPVIETVYLVNNKSYTIRGIDLPDISDSQNLTAEEFSNRYPPGKQVTVHYNPDNPQEAFVEG